MKSLLLMSILFITTMCSKDDIRDIIESPKINPKTEEYIKYFDIDMRMTVDVEDGSCSIGVWIHNYSQYDLKKMIITYEVCNRIGERLSDNKNGRRVCKISLIGPVLKDKGYWSIVDDVFWNHMADHVRILSVDVEYIRE